MTIASHMQNDLIKVQSNNDRDHQTCLLFMYGTILYGTIPSPCDFCHQFMKRFFSESYGSARPRRHQAAMAPRFGYVRVMR